MAEIVKVCPICGKEFIAKRKERIFCSKNCQYKSRSIDITGKKFGRLTVIKRVENYISPAGHSLVQYLCKCDCGNEIVVTRCNLTRNNTLSCGCLQVEKAITVNTSHNLSKKRIYYLYRSMRNRCILKTDSNYKRYGARGIKVCQEWLDDFMNFYNWAMANNYNDTLTLDRIDVNGDYCPENCRWVTPKKQANNKRNNHKETFNGETHTISEWGDILNIKPRILYNRLNTYKWSVEKAFTTPIRK